MAPEATPAKRTRSSLCKATRADGKPCKGYAGGDGYCVAHSPKYDMQALGRAGGRASARSRLGIDDELADDRLRAKAKRRLEELLDSPEESKRLAAARALYSYSAQRPPDEAPTEWHPDRLVEQHDTGSMLRKLWEVGLIRCGTCDGPLTPLGELTPPVIRDDESEAA